MGKRLGIMGGTFDPIHQGHLVTADAARAEFGMDEVLFVPTGRPWMKEHTDVSEPEHRYLMTVIATASHERFGVSRIEVDREGPTYAIDTLRAIRSDRGEGTDLFFITGADAILEILQWKEPEEVFELATFVAATRPGYDLSKLEQIDRLSVLTVPALAISSTDIRRRVAEGRPITYLVPEGVEKYIEKVGLYR